MNKKGVTIFLSVLLVIVSGWYFLWSFQAKKIEIVNDEQRFSQITEQSIEASENSTEDSVVTSEGSSFEKEPIVTIDEKKEAAAETMSKLKIVNRLVNFGFQSADDRKIDTIIIHSSYDAIGSDPFSVSGIIQEYRDYGVSAHYLIGRDGSIHQLVQEKNIAYHAGLSKVPDGRTAVNTFSLGVELVNTKTNQMTAQQYVALQSLISDIKSRYEIKYILGHNQIAPGRKDDPWNFNWSRLK